MIAHVKAFGAFWYDFIIGDDWRIAAGVVAALAITYGLAEAVGHVHSRFTPSALAEPALIQHLTATLITCDSKLAAASRTRFAFDLIRYEVVPGALRVRRKSARSISAQSSR